MSAILLEQTLAYVRGQFTKAEVTEVRSYAGEFSSEEVAQVSYTCPAIFVTVLGWQPQQESRRLVGRYVRAVRMAAFVVYKHANREKRMAGAMHLADKLGVVMRRWRPDSTGLPLTIAPLEEDARCENLYGRAIDSKGQALWLVDWTQDIAPQVPLEALYDLLTVEITDLTRRGEVPASPTPAPTPLTVTDDVQFPID